MFVAFVTTMAVFETESLHGEGTRMSRVFASQGDLTEKRASIAEVGDKRALIVEAQAIPRLARVAHGGK